MQAAHRSTLRLVRSLSARPLTMSEIARRPPGRSTRAASEKTRSLRGDRLTTPFEMTASKLASAKGSSSMWACTSSTWANPASSRRRPALASCSSVMSTPATRPASPTSTAAQNRSVPDPEPRSSTASPGRRADEVEVIAHPGERRQRLGGDPVQQLDAGSRASRPPPCPLRSAAARRRRGRRGDTSPLPPPPIARRPRARSRRAAARHPRGPSRWRRDRSLSSCDSFSRVARLNQPAV